MRKPCHHGVRPEDRCLECELRKELDDGRKMAAMIIRQDARIAALEAGIRQHADWAQEAALAEERRALKPEDLVHYQGWVHHRAAAKAYRAAEEMARALLAPSPGSVTELKRQEADPARPAQRNP